MLFFFIIFLCLLLSLASHLLVLPLPLTRSLSISLKWLMRSACDWLGKIRDKAAVCSGRCLFFSLHPLQTAAVLINMRAHVYIGAGRGRRSTFRENEWLGLREEDGKKDALVRKSKMLWVTYFCLISQRGKYLPHFLPPLLTFSFIFLLCRQPHGASLKPTNQPCYAQTSISSVFSLHLKHVHW